MIPSFIPTDNDTASREWQHQIIQYINQSDIQIDVEPSEIDNFIKILLMIV